MTQYPLKIEELMAPDPESADYVGVYSPSPPYRVPPPAQPRGAASSPQADVPDAPAGSSPTLKIRPSSFIQRVGSASISWAVLGR